MGWAEATRRAYEARRIRRHTAWKRIHRTPDKIEAELSSQGQSPTLMRETAKRYGTVSLIRIEAILEKKKRRAITDAKHRLQKYLNIKYGKEAAVALFPSYWELRAEELGIKA